MMPMYMMGVCVCVCVKRFCGPVYVLVDLSYISQHFPPKQGDRGNEGSK